MAWALLGGRTVPTLTKGQIAALSPDAQARIGQATATGKRWSNAQPTEADGIKFPSKVEARAWARLVERYGVERIVRQVRMPLWCAPGADRRCLYMTIDFAVLDSTRSAVLWWIDAKAGKRRSPEWVRGKAMFEASWGPLTEWDGKGDLEVFA